MHQEFQPDKSASPPRGIHWYSLLTFITPGQIPLLCGGVIVSIAAGGVQPIAGYFVGKIFGAISGYDDGGDHAKMRETVQLNCICLCGLALISWALQILVTAAWMISGQLESRRLRQQVFDALLNKDIAWFDMKEGGVQAVLVRLQTQINDIQESLSYPLPAIIEEFALCMVSLIVAMSTSWKLTMVTLSVLPLLSFPSALVSTKLNQANRDFQENLKKAAKCAMETIQSIDTVKCFNAETYEYDRYANAMTLTLSPWIRASRLMSIVGACGQLFYYSIFIVAFWYGNHMVASQQVTAADVVTTFWAAFSAMGSFGSIMPNIMEMKTGQVSAAFLLDLILENQDLQASSGHNVVPEECHGDIIFNDVSFHYPSRPGISILDKASLSIDAGRLTYIVGPSGAGKSTIGSLLVGFYRACSGSITLDGISLDDISLNWLRENVTLVQQKTVLFKETLLRNIALCSSKPTEASLFDILECVRFASLNEVIEDLPAGLYTHVGLGGTSLSGGEAQRIALARARLRDSPILILDEPTSALDFTTKTTIMKGIRDWRKGKTTIVITHDLTQIDDDDVVYVVEGGKVTKRERNQGVDYSLEVAARSSERSTMGSPAVSNGRRSLRMNRDDFLDNSYLHYWRFARHSVPNAPYTATTSTTTSFSDNHSPNLTESPGQARRRRARQVKTASAIIPQANRPASLYNALRDSGIPFESDSEARRLEKISRFLGEPIGHYNNRSPSLDIRRRVDGFSPKTPLVSGGVNMMTPQAEGTLPEFTQVSPDEEYMSLAQIMKTIPDALDTRHQIILFLALLCVAIHAATAPVFSHLFGKLLGTFSDKSRGTADVQIWSVGIIVVAVIDAVAHFWMVYLLEYIAAVWVNKYREDAMYGMLRQPKEWFESKTNKVASLSMTLDQYGEEMKGLLSRSATSIFTGALILIIGTIWSLVICWKLALIGMSCGPVLFLATRLDLRVNGVWNNRYNQASEAVSDVYIETFADIRTIRGLALESYFRGKLDRFRRRAASIGFRRSWCTGIMGGWGHSSVFLIYALVFWFGGLLVASGSYPSGSVISSIMMLTFTVVSTTPIFEAVSHLSVSQQSASRLLQLALLPHNESHEYQGSSLVFRLAPIKFHHVTFAYETNKENVILKQISFEIASNSCTAIVGHSGSGKSTIAALLVKLYGMSKDVINGTITLNGRDIRDLQAAALRCLISIVPQTPTIFPMSIAENIAYGLEKFAWNNTLTHIQAAAQAAGIDEFISSLPDGFETILGENGVGLSGGQAQRLAIARALLRQPKVLILDEATANLDNESAAQVKETIRNLLEGTRTSKKLTVIVITHARDMVELSNRAIVLNQGQVVEAGRTKDLLKRPNGKLRELFMLVNKDSGLVR